MQTIGPGDSGREVTVDNLEASIKAIRKGKEGLTDTTIAKHPLLLTALQAATPKEGAERLRQLARALGDEPFALAVRGSLAIDFPAGKGAVDRTRMMCAREFGKTSYLSVDSRQTERLKNVGAAALAQAIWLLRHPESVEEPPSRPEPAVEALSPAEIVMPGLQQVTADILEDTTVSPDDTPPAAVEPQPSTRSRRRSWLIGISVTAVAALIAAISYFSFFNKAESTIAAPDPALMAKFDGFDPRGSEPDNRPGVRCDQPPSEAVEGVSAPPVIGPEGKVVAVLRLRRSPLCSTIWARVVWNDDVDATYKVPDGWILHVVIHRPSTHTMIDATEPEPGKPPNAGPIQFGLSRMLTTQPGCIYAETYFTKDNARTNSAMTSCAN